MEVHLVDGTYELFRQYYARPEHLDPDGVDVGAVRGVCRSILTLIEEGATHVGVATDHVVESFRNELWPGYKTSEGMEPALLAQFPLLEDALRAMGVAVWAMVDLEADDGLASAASVAAADSRVERVVICTPDKDLAQCVHDPRVLQLDRRRERWFDESAVREKFGVSPASIPDWLALVGDSADGFPGLPGWGARSASTVLARYDRLEAIPADAAEWDVSVRGAAKLAAAFRDHHEDVLLFRELATLRTDAQVGVVDDWEWRGPTPELTTWAERVGARDLVRRTRALADARG